ncbi:MAG: hypothetical protein HN909_04165, partial [Phycisphaerales bacterium]|nr:hypothetical protein [Phycisphaerales bacterium]
ATTDHTAQDVLVVFDLESSLIRMDAVVAEIDRLPLQVLIEATILSVVLDDSNALGVDLSILGGHTNHNRMDMVSTLDGLPSFQEDATGITNFKRLAAGGTTSFSKMVPAADGGLSMGIISNNVAAFIRALETTTDTTVLANPKLLVVSHCLGEVNVGEEQGYLKGSTSTASATTETTEMLETGTILKVRPFIGKDGKIRMEIHPEISSGNVVEKANTALPEKKVSQVDTSVIVNDGKTIVIGGLFQEETTLKRNRVPLLGTLPTVGALFRGHKDEVKRSELIVLITPHIVGYQEAEAASEQVMEYINRARLGARRGLKWWGRNRRSDMFLTLARKSVASGDRTKARWMLSMALANTPMREEAIKMGQSLNGWDYSSEEPTLHFVETMLKQKAPPALKTKMFPANAKPKAKAKAKAKIKKASKKAAVKIVPVKTKPAKKAPAKKAPAEIMATPVAVMMPARPEPQALALPTPKN